MPKIANITATVINPILDTSASSFPLIPVGITRDGVAKWEGTFVAATPNNAVPFNCAITVSVKPNGVSPISGPAKSSVTILYPIIETRVVSVSATDVQLKACNILGMVRYQNGQFTFPKGTSVAKRDNALTTISNILTQLMTNSAQRAGMAGEVYY